MYKCLTRTSGVDEYLKLLLSHRVLRKLPCGGIDSIGWTRMIATSRFDERWTVGCKHMFSCARYFGIPSWLAEDIKIPRFDSPIADASSAREVTFCPKLPPPSRTRWAVSQEYSTVWLVVGNREIECSWLHGQVLFELVRHGKLVCPSYVHPAHFRKLVNALVVAGVLTREGALIESKESAVVKQPLLETVRDESFAHRQQSLNRVMNAWLVRTLKRSRVMSASQLRSVLPDHFDWDRVGKQLEYLEEHDYVERDGDVFRYVP